MICPLLESPDPRCATHFSLVNLNDAFLHCVGRYQACPIYQGRLHQRAGATSASYPHPLSPAVSRAAG